MRKKNTILYRLMCAAFESRRRESKRALALSIIRIILVRDETMEERNYYESDDKEEGIKSVRKGQNMPRFFCRISPYSLTIHRYR